jgi:hypothetical protein
MIRGSIEISVPVSEREAAMKAVRETLDSLFNSGIYGKQEPKIWSVIDADKGTQTIGFRSDHLELLERARGILADKLPGIDIKATKPCMLVAGHHTN